MKKIILIIALLILIIGCETSFDSGVAIKTDTLKVAVQASPILEINTNGYISKGLWAWIEYNYEINCYVLNIQQEQCGESVPLWGTDLRITIIPK